MLVRDLLAIIGRVAPPGLAADWDNCGLQTGSSEQPVTKIGFSLDATPSIVTQALGSGCDVLLTHHPLFFKSFKYIDFSRGSGLIVRQALAGGLTVIAAHTNWDAASGGVAYALAQALGLINYTPLELASAEAYKMVTYVPTGHENKVREALFAAGAGGLGAYDRCWFAAEGTGGFRVPPEGQPFHGQPGQETTVKESRLEVMLPLNRAQAVVQALWSSHPYEKPAFELHRVKIFNKDEGLGLVGEWCPPRDLFTELDRFGAPYKWSGPRPGLVERVALLPGSGGDFLGKAKSTGAEVLITADVSYHRALEAHDLGLTLVDLGHFETEWPGVLQLARVLESEIKRRGMEVECLVLSQNPTWNHCQPKTEV